MNSQITARRTFLKKRSSPLTIGFTAIADFTSFIGQEYISGIMKAAEHYGLNFINMTSAVRPSLFVDKSFLKQYLSKTAFMHAPLLDGLVTWASSLSGYMKNEEIQRLFSSLSPLPMVDIGYLDIPRVPSIRIDNDYSIHLLVEHLVKVHRFTKIAFFGSRFSLPHQLRLESFKKEMALLGKEVSDDLIFLADSLDEQDVAPQVENLLKAHGTNAGNSGRNPIRKLSVDAILTSSDIIAHHIIEELEKHGISVPDDVAMTGFNNQLAGLTASSPITTIDLAYFKRGYEAVEILIDQIMQNEIPRTARNDGLPIRNDIFQVQNGTFSPQGDIFLPQIHTVPTSLVVRQSCGCFEEEILDAQNGEPDFSHAPHNFESEIEIRAYLERSIQKVFAAATEGQKSALAEAIISDLFAENVPPPVYTKQSDGSGRTSKIIFPQAKKNRSQKKYLRYAVQSSP